MTDNEYINAILDTLKGSAQTVPIHTWIAKKLNEEESEHEIRHTIIVDLMKAHGLIEHPYMSSPDFYKLTSFGHQISQIGWLKHLEEINNEEDEIDRLKKEKDEFEEQVSLSQIRNAKLNTRLNYLMVVFTAGLLLVGVYTIYLTDKTSSLEAQLEEAKRETDSLSKMNSDQTRLLKTKDMLIHLLSQKMDSIQTLPNPKKK